MANRLKTPATSILVLAFFLAADPAYSISYADGAIGSAPAECGAGDLCATLSMPDGTRLETYNEGAGHCQPFGLRVVKMRGDLKLFDYEAKTEMLTNDSGIGQPCNFSTTYLTFDNGKARVGFFLNPDGALSARWQSAAGVAATSFVSGRPKRGDEAAPRPMLIEADFSREMQNGHPKFCHADADTWMPWENIKCHNYRVEWYF